MANAEHLTLLKEAVEDWNRWRTENPSTHPDLSNSDLSGANLSGAYTDDDGSELIDEVIIPRIDFLRRYRRDLTGTNFSGTNLAGSILADADLRACQKSLRRRDRRSRRYLFGRARRRAIR
jgi:uncharacterized protein YjbI with pentapeptide repeats